MTLVAESALGALPPGLRGELLNEYAKIARNYREGRWEAAELDGGRFCEIVFTICSGFLNGGQYPASASKPARFADDCAALGKLPASRGPKSVRVGIPRVLVALYDVRNNRGVGHVGGEVDANHMDATFVLHTAQWVMAELVRIFHTTDTVTASAVVDSLVDRTLPVIWAVGDRKRVLTTGLPLSKQTLLLVYGEPAGRSDRALAEDLGQPRLSDYRRVLRRLHKERLVEYSADGTVAISPTGARLVEDDLLAKVGES